MLSKQTTESMAKDAVERYERGEEGNPFIKINRGEDVFFVAYDIGMAAADAYFSHPDHLPIPSYSPEVEELYLVETQFAFEAVKRRAAELAQEKYEGELALEEALRENFVDGLNGKLQGSI